MAYDEGLAQRIREALDEFPGLVEKTMVGGVGFVVQGSMACGVHKQSLIVRVGPDRYSEALGRPATKEFDITGRSTKGWVMVSSDELEFDEALNSRVKQGVEFALCRPNSRV